MRKKTKHRTKSKSKRASEDSVRAALSILENMSESDKEAQVMVIGPFFTLTFAAAVEKLGVDGWYTLGTEGFDLSIAPAMSDAIQFSPDGGLFLSRKGMAMTIEIEEHSAEELLARYPGASKLIN